MRASDYTREHDGGKWGFPGWWTVYWQGEVVHHAETKRKADEYVAGRLAAAASQAEQKVNSLQEGG